MAQRTSDNDGNDNLRATGEERSIGMRADSREAPSAERTFQNSASTHANAGVQMLDLDVENSESDALASDNAPIILAQAPQSQGAVAAAGPVGGKILGTIQFVTGDVKIVGVDGVARLAQVGDKVAFKETVVTGADGIVQIRLDNGQLVDVGRNAQLALDTDFFGYDAGQGLHAATGAVATPPAPAVEPPAKPAAPGTDVAELQRQIAAGQDPSQIAPATAAGGAPAAGGAGGDGSGGTPVLVDQANSTGPVTAGFLTGGGSIAFPTPEFQLLAGTAPPVISVSVQVQVQVQPAPGETPTPVDGLVGVDAASVIEGTAPTTQTVNFIIFLDKTFASDVQVTYAITPPGADGHGADITGTLTATVTIPAGETSIIVPVEIVRDHFVEGNEPFTITLVNADGADINPDQSSAVITIVDDDVNPVAHNDTNWTKEETSLTATGNVLEDHNHAGAPSGAFADVRDVDTDAIHVTTTGTFAGAHGTLVLNADGSYTYTLNNADAAVQQLDSGETLVEAFNYTITDEGNNTPSSATLNITIFGTNDGPQIVVQTGDGPFATGAQAVVDEAALATGSNPSSNAEFVSGSFQVSDPDGLDDIQSVTINGSTVAIGSLVGSVFHGSAGDMTVTSYANGTANFTYELKHSVTDVTNQAETDVFTLTTSDGTDSSAPAAITITIIDDVPQAVNDANSIAEDEVPNTISGNVLANDHSNADAPAALVSWDGNTTATYGTITLNADGTYSYQLNNSLTAVQTLVEGEHLTETFHYTMRDADGDTSPATLTITINGTDDGVTITDLTPAGQGGEATVSDANLPDGSSPNNAALTKTGDFTISAPDGVKSLTVGGVEVITNNAFVGGTITTGLGNQLQITAYDAATGKVTYSYTLLDNENHVQPSSDTSLFDNSSVVLVDDDGDTANNTLSIQVLDDQPTVEILPVVADGNPTTDVVLENSDPITGNWTRNYFADADSNGDAAAPATTKVTVGGLAGEFDLGDDISVAGKGTLTVDANGTWTFAPAESVLGTQSVTFTVTIIDADGDVDSDTHTVQIADKNSPIGAEDVANPVDEEGLANGIAGGPINDDAGENTSVGGTLTFAYGDDGANPTTPFVWNTNALPSIQTSADESSVSYAVVGGTSLVAFTAAGSAEEPDVFVLTIDPGTHTYQFTLFKALEHPAGDTENNIDFTFGYTVMDADGSTANGTLSLTVDDDTPVASIRPAEGAQAVMDDDTIGTPVTVDASDLFVSGAQSGADTPAQTSYGLVLGSGEGTNSGLMDSATSTQILLFTNGSGDVEGRLGSSGGAVAFTIHVDSGTGELTVTQAVAIKHNDPADPIESGAAAETLAAGSLLMQQSIVDSDADGSTASFDLGSLIKFEDSGPSVSGTTSASVDEEGLTGGNAGDSYATGDLAGQAITATGSLGVSFGADGPATSGSGYTLSATGATWDATTRTLSENGGAWTVTVATNGTYTFNLLQPMTHTVANTEDDLTINVGFTATDKDGDTKTGAFTVTVDDDAPVISGTTSASVDEEGLTGGNAGDSYATGDLAGQAITATGSLGVSFGADGPATSGSGYTLSATGATWDATTRTLSENGGAWTVTVATNGTYTFNLLQPMTHTVANTEDDLTINVGFTATDKDGDTKTGAFTVTVDDDAPVISGTTSASVDEEGLTGGNAGDSYATGDLAGQAITATGSLGVSFGADGPATSGSGYTLSATGATWDATTRTLSENGGAWTVTVATNGTYTFNLLQPMTHTVANTEDDLTINVGFTATDKDGDTKTGAFTVTVDDDAPVISGTTSASVDEEGLTGGNAGDSYATGDLAGQAITATGSLGVSFGADGPATSGSGYTLSATGATWDATTRTLSENGGAWTVTVATNGTYTFNLLQPMTHTVANTEDDLTINVGFTATDKDGDTKTGAFTVTVDDDAPVISGTTSASVDEEGLTGGNAGDSYATGDLAGQAITATGSLGVSFGADGPATSGSGYTLSATGATWDATTRTLSENGGAWTVTVATNGTYTFNLLQPMTHTVANTEDDLTINVGFTATDKDGDTKTGAFTVTVDDDAPVISGTTSASVDEEGLTGGNAGDSYATGDLAGQAITATGSLGVSFGADGPATSGSGYTLSATGATWDATTRTLSENGGAWTVTVATNGTYTFNLLQPMTHTVANTEDDLTINVGFTATDKDGDTKTGAFTVTVDDDAPVISGTTSASVDEEGLTGGNAGDSYATGDLAGQAITATGSLGVSFGADGPATSGSGYTLSATGATWDATTRTLSENGGAWTVTVATNGTYTFNLLQPMTHTVANTEDDLTINVGFTATDKDGDTKTGAFTVTVDDDAPVISGTTSASVDEEGLTGGNAGDSYATGDLAGQAITATGSLGVSFGADGPATSGSGYTLSATGATWDATTRTLSENGGAWTVTVATNGTYTFNLLQPMTHTVANTEDDLTINVGFTATDKDGDTKTGAFTVTVDDDAPVISGTTSASVDEEGLTGGNAGDSYATGDLAGQAITATGSLGVSFGADGPATSGSGYTLSATGATWDATTRTLSENGGAWTVTVATNGTYTFNLLQPMTHTVANTEDDLTINVGFTATDKDGDTKTGAFTVTVDDDAPVISGTTSASVDEEGLTGGNAGDSYATGDLAGQAITATGSLGVSFGADGPATSGSGYTLSATGATWDATTRTLSENGGAWTVTVATNGTYTFNLLQPMTHTVANTEDDLTINVGFTATDKDGDTKTGAFTVTVDDDAPVISGTTSASVDEEGLTGGNAGDSYATGDLAGQAITATGSLGVSFGADGPATSGSGYTLSATGATWDATTRTLSENGGAWTVTVATNGTYTFNLLQPMTHTVANTEDDLTINVGFTATDKDGDTKTGAFTVTVDDDAPVISGTTSASVDEEGLTGGNAGDSYATGDLAGQAITATGSLGVSFGADGPATSGSGYTLSATGATWDATTRTLSENGGAWTVTVATNGTYTFNLLQPMTHTVANTEDDLTINVGFTATDKDGDTKTGAFTVTVDDDAPVMLARTDLIYPNSANDGPGGTVNGGTGIFKYSIGADKPTYADGTHSDFGSITLSGNVGSNAITVTQQPLWQSENASTATFSFAFDYFKDPAHTLPASDTGTIVFNKAAGTYTVELGAPIDSYAVSTTSSAQGFSGYNFDSTPAASNPPVSVAQLTSSFFVQFSGMEEGTITTTKAAAGTYNAGLPAGGDLFTADASYVTISNLSNGVHGDTMQRGEILDMDFFLANPLGDINAPSTAYANAIFLKFDNIGSGEDLVVVLKLFDGVTHTTKAIVVDNGDIFKFGDTLPTGYNITLDNNDGAAIIESNDYNSGLEHYQIEGAQVLVSTRNITGTGIDLNSTSANGGASTGTQTLETGETGNGEPVKISDIGFVSTSNVTQTANLLFNVTLKDADGDTAPTQQLDVTVVNGLTFTGGADHEAIQGSAGNDTLTGAGGNDILTGGAGVDTFDFNSPTQGVDTIKDFNAGAGEVLDLKDIFTGSETRADLVTAGKLVFTAVDADGVGGANDVQVAVNLGGSGALTSTVTLVNVLNATIGDLNNDTNTKVS